MAMTVVVQINEAKAFEASNHVFPAEYEGHFDSLLIDASDIRQRTVELAASIHNDYHKSRPVLICTLKGACPFFVHLCDALQDLRQGFDVEFVRASSYDGTASTGSVTLSKDGLLDVTTLSNRHVILIEDIVDTGTTLATIVPLLMQTTSTETPPPASVQVCTLLEKRLDNDATGSTDTAAPHKKAYEAKYCGFSIPNLFVIGYGLDYNERYRDLKDIFVISQKGIDCTELGV